jgi:hypothetical protein
VAACALVGLGLVCVAVAASFGATGVVFAGPGVFDVWESREAVVVSQRNLAGVTAISVESVGADVEFVPSDDFGFEARTDRGDPVWSVEGGVLSVREHESAFATQFSGFANLLTSDGEASIQVFYPQDARLDSLHVSTVSGEVSFPELAGAVAGLADFHSTSGSLRVDSLEAQRLAFTTVSGDIRGVDVSAPETRVESTSGDIDLAGLAGDLTVETTSGRVKLAGGELWGKLNSVSGDIEITTSVGPDDIGYRTQTVSGDVRVDGTPADGASRRAPADGRELEIKTTSGDIELNFGK